MSGKLAALGAVGLALGATALVAVSAGGAGADRATASVRPTIPTTPSVKTMWGDKRNNTRSYELTASQFTQQIANFPIKTASVWGYNGSTPGPTLIARRGERVRVRIQNQLPPTQIGDQPERPTATTVHFHGMHGPNEVDGVAGISQPNPIEPGESYTYEFKPGHAGTFAYHAHTDDAVQELRGLNGIFIILPRREAPSDKVDKDFAMTLQQFAPAAEGALVAPFPPGTGDFPFSTINGKTGDASGGPLVIEKGDRVRIRIYNASNMNHSMHLHGHDSVLVSKNGHPVPRLRETTQDVAPGDFFEIEFKAKNPGNWVFHCHVPHHTSNKMQSGFNGSTVGMTRVFHYKGYDPVPGEYFDYEG